jgi:hypothetical protein
MTHNCTTCALAEWSRTKTGRLHPSGEGRCSWRMTPTVIPAAFYWSGWIAHRQPEPSGGYIDRREPKSDCPTWEPK